MCRQVPITLKPSTAASSPSAGCTSSAPASIAASITCSTAHNPLPHQSCHMPHYKSIAVNLMGHIPNALAALTVSRHELRTSCDGRCACHAGCRLNLKSIWARWCNPTWFVLHLFLAVLSPDKDKALPLEVEEHGAAVGHLAAGFGDGRPHLRGAAVHVVGQALHHKARASRAVCLVCDLHGINGHAASWIQQICIEVLQWGTQSPPGKHCLPVQG